MAGGSPPATITSCEALSATDLLPLYVAALLALLPDMSEVSVAGVGTLKRRLQHQEERSRELQTELSSLRLRVDARLSQSQSQTLNVFPTPSEVSDISSKRLAYFQSEEEGEVDDVE